MTASGKEFLVKSQNEIKQNELLKKVVQKFTSVLKEKNENDFLKLFINKERFLPKIIKHEKNVYDFQLQQLGLSEDLIKEALQKIEDETITGFSNITDFLKLLNIKQEDSIENILMYPLVLKESASSIEVIFPFLKWGDGRDPNSSKVIVWVFDNNGGEPVLTDVNYDYNQDRTKAFLKKGFSEIWLVISPVRSLESNQQYIQLSITIETSAEDLSPAKSMFEKVKDKIEFPEKLGLFTAGYNAMTEPSITESQIGEKIFYTIYLDYSTKNNNFGAMILPDIEINVLGDKLLLEQPIIIYRPRG